jgi:hypothetical protein
MAMSIYVLGPTINPEPLNKTVVLTLGIAEFYNLSSHRDFDLN